MATSSLLGIDRTAPPALGRDSDLLGPSDTSDSGSDIAGIALPDDGGPDAPLDKAIAPDVERSYTSRETTGPGIDSDSHGTGERRSAASDAGERDAADISPDRIVSDPNGDGVFDRSDDPDAGLVEPDDDDDTSAPFADVASDGADDEEDEDADPVGDPQAGSAGGR